MTTPVVGAVARPVRSRAAVSAAYAAQGFGYATVVTALPALKERQGIDDTMVSVVVLLVCLAAAAGSVAAGRLGSARGSRVALVAGFAVQAVALPFIALPIGTGLFVVAFGVYGLGLGMVDAASGMQAVVVQHRHGTTIMSGFFAWYTGAAMAGALLMSALAGTSSAVSIALVVAAVLLGATAAVGRRHLEDDLVDVRDLPADPSADGASAAADPHRPLPTRGILIFGSVVLAAFVADSAVSTWSTIYLHDVLVTSAAVAPLGYAAYQAAILVTRLASDAVVRRIGRAPVVAVTAAVSAVGFLLVALLPSAAAAIVGFAVVGVGVGTLVPLSFSAAGELDPARTVDVIARLNLFNYAGAVLGAVLVGLLSDAPGLALAFLLPMVLLLPTVALARHFGAQPPVTGSRHTTAMPERPV